MTMPKGFKVENGYATSAELGGKSYHQIAEIMTDRGFKMNHSTARNIFVSGLSKIASNLIEIHGINFDAKRIKEIAIDPRFQEAVSDYMRDIQHERKSQTNNK